jgi:hypothetical protein
VKGVSISGNSIYNINTNGINVGYADNLVVSGNSVYATNLVADATGFTAIDIVGCDGVSCTGNVVTFVGPTNNAYGIRFFTLTAGVMSGNSVTNSNASATATNLFVQNCTNCLVVGNRSIGNKYAVALGSNNPNTGNTFIANYVTGALTANYLDSSSGTNYNYGSVDAGAFTVPGALTTTGNATFSANVIRSVSAAVTASTTHTQVGATALTADINNVSVCANADDAVKLPTAVAGLTITVMNNGAQNLRIWPALGDNLGTGVDTVRGALAAGSNVRFTSYDATNWEEI